MNTSRTAAAAALTALVALTALPFVTIDDLEVTAYGWHLATGLGAIALTLVAATAGELHARTGRRRFALAVLTAGLGQLALLLATWATVWRLVPCARLGLSSCDAQTGGLMQDALVTLDIGWVAALMGAVVQAFLGLALCLQPRRFRPDERFLRVLLSWDGEVVADRVLFAPKPVTVGEADTDTLQLPSSGLRGHVLLRPEAGGHWLLDVPRAVRGRLTLDGQERPADGLARLHPGDQGRLAFENDVEVAFTFTGAETTRLSFGSLGDPRLLVSLAAVAAAVLVLGTAALSQWRRDRRNLQDEAVALHTDGTIEVDFAVTPPEPPAPDKADGPPLQPPPQDEGKRGDPDRPQDKLEKRGGPDQKAARGETKDPMRNSLVGAMHDPRAQQGALGEILGNHGGVMHGTELAAHPGDGSGQDQPGGGSDGMGFRGIGSGGPGGNGPVSFKGQLPGGKPVERLDHGRHVARRVLDPTREPPRTQGFCQSGDIRKGVMARAFAIRACYEQQLLSHQDLAGKITVLWTIQGDGTVSGLKATSDTVGSNVVTDCVLRALSHARFQAPEGGVCIVSWPFAFSTGH